MFREKTEFDALFPDLEPKIKVDRAGFEPATSALRTRRSYQLNYRPTLLLSERTDGKIIELSVFL
jgi:hypothetical protein